MIPAASPRSPLATAPGTSGAPLAVGIPGTFCAPLVFDPLAAALRNHDEPVLLEAVSWMELPGPWDIPSVAANVASRIAAAGNGPVLVVGHSTGGAIAMQLALDYPEFVAGLVVVDSGAHMKGHGDVGAIVRRIREDGPDEVIEAVLERSFASMPPEGVVGALRGYARSVDPRAALEALDSQRVLDFTDVLGGLGCPVAVVQGRHDRVRTVADAQAFASLFAGAKLAVLDCGHTPPFEAPTELAAVVRNLSDQLAGDSTPD